MGYGFRLTTNIQSKIILSCNKEGLIITCHNELCDKLLYLAR